MKTKYSNYTIFFILAFPLNFLFTDCKNRSDNKPSAQNQINSSAALNTDNSLTQQEISEGWLLLFDGKTSKGWINAKSWSFPSDGWKIENGTLIVDPEGKTKNGGGDIVTEKKFRNFELTIDFNYAPGANSGVKYFVDTEINNGEMASIGCEYQILDDRLNEDAKAGLSGNHTLSSLYDLIPPQNVKDNGPGTWNRAFIIVNGNKVQHWLNGNKTVEYERGTTEWRALVATSKYKDFMQFGENQEGRILLQDHGHEVSFKNIKIREIK